MKRPDIEQIRADIVYWGGVSEERQIALCDYIAHLERQVRIIDLTMKHVRIHRCDPILTR